MKTMSLVHKGQLDGSFPNISGLIPSSIVSVAELESEVYDIFSGKYSFIIEVHKIIPGKGSGNACFNRMMAPQSA